MLMETIQSTTPHAANSQVSTPRGFFDALQTQLERPLIFDLGGGKRVPVGYHVTEIKALNLQTVDCGGVVNAWKETVVQLWRSDLEPDTSYMTAGKFLKIVRAVVGNIALEQGSNLRFEYGDDGQPAVTYTVERLEPTSEGLIVHLEWIGVRCKALDRVSAARAEAGLSELTVLEGGGGSCSPGGACGC